MAQTTDLLPGLKKFYKKHLSCAWLDKISRWLMELYASIICVLKGWHFPKKFNWEWKLEMLLNQYEKETVSLFKNKVRPGMLVIDIGAHIGYFTRLSSKLVGPTGKVYAFEADPKNYDLLKRNVKKYKNVTIDPRAISNKVGTINFYETTNHTGCHSLIPADFRSNKITVQTTTLDELFLKGKIKKIDIIKMDIEGAEPLALQGMKKVIEDNPSIMLIIEFCPDHFKYTDMEPAEFIEKLHELNLQVYAIHDKELKKITPEDNKNKQYFLKRWYVNLFCVKHL